MEKFSLTVLFGFLILLIIISGFFSAAETGMMAINRYRLRHLARKKHFTAMRVNKLLERPDKLLGVILIGSTFANIFAASVATIIAVRLWGNIGIMIASISLTLIILIFAEITPKTYAASHPQRVAFFSAWTLHYFLKIFYPLVWLANLIANRILKLLNLTNKRKSLEHLTSEELSTIVSEAGDKIPDEHQTMLLAILGLEKISVDDIMIPRNEIIGIDLENNWEEILRQLKSSQHNRLPIYEGSIDKVKGVLHQRVALNLLAREKLDKKTLLKSTDEAYFVPEGTSLNKQLINFRKAKQRSALIVDEYGDILGLVTLEDILEEIVGEFTTDIAAIFKVARSQSDGSYLVSGSINIRELNKEMQWEFDVTGPKTLSGLIIEYLETIPKPGISLMISGYPIEIISVVRNRINTIKIFPRMSQKVEEK